MLSLSKSKIVPHVCMEVTIQSSQQPTYLYPKLHFSMMTMQLLRPGAWCPLLSLIGSAEHRPSLKVIKKNVEDTGNAYRVYFDL